MAKRERGFTAPELVVTVAVVGILSSLALQQGGGTLARMRVESVTRRVALGLEMGRAAAEREGSPCALQLSERGWHGPDGGDLPACAGVELELGENGGAGGVGVEHNFPDAVRFSSNGLVLDGGTVVVRAAGTDLARCLVMSLPLGVVRLGLHEEGGCRAEPS